LATPKLVPFNHQHLLSIDNRDPWITDDHAIRERDKNPGFSALVDDKVIMCAGVIIQWAGMGTAWSIVTTDFLKHRFWCTRMVRLGLRDIIKIWNLHRVEMVVLSDQPVNKKFAEMLGFERENGRARQYSATRDDVIRYEFIVED
jgi:hypothetical protein